MFLLNIGLVPIDRFQSIFRLSAKKSEVWATAVKWLCKACVLAISVKKSAFWATCHKMNAEMMRFGLKLDPIRMHWLKCIFHICLWKNPWFAPLVLEWLHKGCVLPKHRLKSEIDWSQFLSFQPKKSVVWATRRNIELILIHWLNSIFHISAKKLTD